jgi:ribosomal protein S18 acetylase RimI-like enzyme
MIELKKVETNQEIAMVSKLAFEIFPVDYLGYVKKENLTNFLTTYQTETAIKNQIDAGFLYYLIREKDEIAGYVGLSFEGNLAFLSKFYLCLDKRNRGLGQNVLKMLEGVVIDRGCSFIELLVLVENIRAIKFYETNGFEINPTFVETFDDIHTEKHYKMIKSLK